MGKDMFLYVVVLLALLVFASFAAISVHSSGLSAGRVNSLTITATGTASNASSSALLYVTVNATGATNGNAVKNITATLNAFNSTIFKYVDGNLSSITTESFQVYKLYNTSGYQATEIMRVEIPEIKNVSPAIGAISSIPSVYVTGATPTLSNKQMSIMRKQALAYALANATSQASSLIGNRPIISSNITVNSYYVIPYAYGVTTSTSSAAANPQFYGGTNKVTESITVVFKYGN